MAEQRAVSHYNTNNHSLIGSKSKRAKNMMNKSYNQSEVSMRTNINHDNPEKSKDFNAAYAKVSLILIICVYS